MKPFVLPAVLGLLLVGLSMAKQVSPTVQVYSRNPGNFGEPNTIICHVTEFYPPEIRIEILKNGVEIPGAAQTDLAFEENWHYHMTKHVKVTPGQKDKITCRVTHLGETKTYIWEPDM